LHVVANRFVIVHDQDSHARYFDRQGSLLGRSQGLCGRGCSDTLMVSDGYHNTRFLLLTFRIVEERLILQFHSVAGERLFGLFRVSCPFKL
jgi:hypothetical protein